MAMVPLELPPGAYYGPTEATYSTRWRELHLMRWKSDALTPLDSWTEVDFEFASRCKRVHQWVDNIGIKYIAYLCEEHLYIDVGGTIIDATPVDGIVGPYSEEGGGVAVSGYGLDNYGEGDYGTPREPRIILRPITPAFTLDTWGEQLLIMTSPDGRLLKWDPQTPGNPAVAVPNAPVGNRFFIVTPERFVVLFGYGGNTRKWGWCDQENNESWADSVTSQAGSYEIAPAAPLLTGVQTRSGMLFFTPKKTYISRSIGLPYVYNYDEVGGAAVPISPSSIVDAVIGAIWVSESGFWIFDGSSVIPLECPIWNWIREHINEEYSRYEATCVHVSPMSEVWWFFPSMGGRYNDRYVIYNYRDKWWSMGKLARSAGSSASYDNFPIMADGTKAYRHGVPATSGYPGIDEMPWAETYTLNGDDGANISIIREMLVDVQGDYADVQFSFLVTDNRTGDVPYQTPKKKAKPNGFVEVRQSGRDFRLRIESGDATSVWTVGRHMIDIKLRGKR